MRDRANAYDARIDGMELRITKYEEGLKKQFAALEQLISTLNSQSSQLSSVMGTA
jgi:flagellar capping protein FliD